MEQEHVSLCTAIMQSEAHVPCVFIAASRSPCSYVQEAPDLLNAGYRLKIVQVKEHQYLFNCISI